MGLGSMRGAAWAKAKTEGIDTKRERQIRALFEAIQPAALEVGAIRSIDLAQARELDRKRTEKGMEPRYTRQKANGDVDLAQATVGNWHGREAHEWPEAILRRTKSLARRNVQDSAAIFVRVAMPGSMHPGVFLIDDLDADAIEDIRTAGLEPSAIVRTSPDSHQAWVRLSDKPVAATTAQAVGGYLNQVFGDSRANNAAQPGRLPGFTNRKPQHENDGRFPFVALVEAGCRTASNGAAWIRSAVENTAERGMAVPPPVPVDTPRRKRDRALSCERKAAGEILSTDDAAMDDLCAAARRYRAAQVQSGEKPGDLHTGSEWQFLACVWAFRKGFDVERIECWVEASMRPDRRGTDYAWRTTANARSCFNDPQAFFRGDPGSRARVNSDKGNDPSGKGGKPNA